MMNMDTVKQSFRRLKVADRSEDTLTKAIENQTSKLPSDLFLAAALGSIGVSLSLRLAGKKNASLFVGQWAPTFLLLGTYNKMVKLFGSNPKMGDADQPVMRNEEFTESDEHEAAS